MPSKQTAETATADQADVEESGLFEDLRVPDEDDAQAVLQPAMSAAAIHLTSCHTPATERAAALDSPNTGGSAPRLGTRAHDGGDQGSDDTASERASPKSPPCPLQRVRHGRSPTGDGSNEKNEKNEKPRQRNLPSPWRAQPQQRFTTRESESRGILGMAFGPPRQRSSSAGQDALRRIQRAFPSLSSPSNLLPSLPTSLWSPFSDTKIARNLEENHRPSARPRVLRRTTSDDSILYSTLSRASSLGDDERFVDVRGMVNIRLMAIRDSLPEVPNFRMPGLARFQAASRMPSISLQGLSLSGLFSTESGPNVRQSDDRGDRGGANIPGEDLTSLDSVLEDLTGDLVVMGGYRGSILRSAEPPHHQLWAPVKVGLNMRKANLELGLSDEDEETAENLIIPSGMLQNIGPIDISRKFFKKLRSCENARTGKLRIWDYGYDWRLSPSRLSRNLLDFMETLPSNQPGVLAADRGAMVIAHSLGGLITRHAVNQRPELFAGVLYAGTPQRCVNILGPLRNGDAVLLNDKLLTAAVNFSIRTSFALLPDDGFCFIDKNTGEEYPVDFFDPMSWVRWRLSPCVATPLPPYNRQQQNSPLSSLLPGSLLKSRSDSWKWDKKISSPPSLDHTGPGPGPGPAHEESTASKIENRTSILPHMGGHANAAPTSMPSAAGASSRPESPPIDMERLGQNLAYLERTLGSVGRFRQETAHRRSHQASNAYPPFAVMYGKSIPTVYAARVNGREAIPCSDAYDDLVFRPGDGVVLAKESMLPEGYALVHGGRVRTGRGHITMLGDMPALGKALRALMRGRQKGIGLGERGSERP